MIPQHRVDRRHRAAAIANIALSDRAAQGERALSRLIGTLIAAGGLTVMVLVKGCFVARWSGAFPCLKLLPVGPGRVLQVPQVARCAHRAVEQFFGFGRLVCVPCVYGVLGQGPGWFLE